MKQADRKQLDGKLALKAGKIYNLHFGRVCMFTFRPGILQGVRIVNPTVSKYIVLSRWECFQIEQLFLCTENLLGSSMRNCMMFNCLLARLSKTISCQIFPILANKIKRASLHFHFRVIIYNHSVSLLLHSCSLTIFI